MYHPHMRKQVEPSGQRDVPSLEPHTEARSRVTASRRRREVGAEPGTLEREGRGTRRRTWVVWGGVGATTQRRTAPGQAVPASSLLIRLRSSPFGDAASHAAVERRSPDRPSLK